MQEFLPIGRMNELEAANMDALKKELRGSIKKGIEFANQGSAHNAFRSKELAKACLLGTMWTFCLTCTVRVHQVGRCIASALVSDVKQTS